jgi:hypothetical protein
MERMEGREGQEEERKPQTLIIKYNLKILARFLHNFLICMNCQRCGEVTISTEDTLPLS